MQYANILKQIILKLKTPQDGEFSSCCHKGKINLPPMTPPRENLKNLYLKNTVDSKNLKENIKQYNKVLALASMGMRKKWQLGNYFIDRRPAGMG